MIKKFKYLLIILPFLFVAINVNAAEYETTGSRATAGLSQYSHSITAGGHVGHYRFTLGGQLAFCLNPGLKMSNGVTYASTRSQSTSSEIYVKAYNYALSHGDEISTAAAQAVIWIGAIDAASIQTALSQWGIGMAQAQQIADGMNATSGNGRLYIWSYIGGGSAGNYQNLLTAKAPDGPDDPPNEPCSMSYYNILPSCNSNIFNSGLIRQIPAGYCERKYSRSSQKYNLSGEKDSTNIGGGKCAAFCLQKYEVTYPGSIAVPVNVGTHIVWPNNDDSEAIKINKNLITYPFKSKLTKECNVYVVETVFTDYNGFKNTMANNKTKVLGSSGDPDEPGWVSQAGDTNYETYVLSNFRTATGDNSCPRRSQEVSAANTKRQQKYQVYVAALNALNSCNSARSSCLSGCGTDTTCSSGCRSCSSEQAAFDKANDEYQKAARWASNAGARNSTCTTYRTAYNSASKLLGQLNSCLKPNMQNRLSYSVSYQASYNDPTYGRNFSNKFTIEEKLDANEPKTCVNCNVIPGVPELLGGGTTQAPTPVYIQEANIRDFANRISVVDIIQTISKRYYLLDKPGFKYYNYVKKDTGESVSEKPNANYTTIGYSNEPISHNYERINDQYDLKLEANGASMNMSRYNSEITNAIVESITKQPYVCHYQVTKVTDDCVCPEGTNMAGKSLVGVIRNNTMTCADAIAQADRYCNTDPCANNNCEPLTCPNDPSMDLTSCVSNGKTYNYCANKFCSRHYKCPNDGPNANMDITACVIPMILRGTSEQNAYEYCKDITCPYGGIKIIYRVIDLDNPFPSYDADGRSRRSTDPKVGDFNDTLYGRYPGSNWNSKLVVKNKIRNNRNVDGEAVYTKNPLYTFVLDSSKIRAIRQYNRHQNKGYADFTLKCRNGSYACRSDFVHNVSYGITGGDCANVGNSIQGFYNCVNK